MNSGRFPLTPPTIAPVAPGIDRPLWSVMIPAYNCMQTIEQTINSVLQQDPGENKMQIEVIDDCSSEPGLEELVNTLGKGRIKYHRHKQNVGHIYTFTTCIERSRGHYIHILHSDDYVLPGYYSKIEQLFNTYPQAEAAFTAFQVIHTKKPGIQQSWQVQENEGIIPNFFDIVSIRVPMHYVTTTVKRRVYEQIGSYYGSDYSEDHIMWARISKNFPVAYSPNVFGVYRHHSVASMSRRSFTKGYFAREVTAAQEVIASMLPAHLIEPRKEQYYQMIADWAISEIEDYWDEERNDALAMTQIKSVQELYTNEQLEKRIGKLKLKIRYPQLWSWKNRITKLLHLF